MKLIRMLALATFMATLAAAQSTNSSGQQPAGKSPSPSPTPSATTTGAGGKPSAATGKATPTAAKKTSAKKTAAKKTGSATAQATSSQTPAATSKTGQGASSQTPAATSKTGQGASPSNKTAAGAGNGVQNNSKGSSGVAAGTTSASAKPGAATKTGTAAGGKPAVAMGTVMTTHKAGTGAVPVQGAVKTTAKKGAKSGKKAPVVGTISPKPPATKGTSTGKTPPTAAGQNAATETKTTRRSVAQNGRRDPFLSIIRTVTAGAPTANCSTGKRCLAIPELVLQGTVRDISGKMIAVVINSNHRTYTLRENDQVFNGSVEKITTDSIIFREFVKDAVGRESAREVVKKISPTT